MESFWILAEFFWILAEFFRILAEFLGESEELLFITACLTIYQRFELCKNH
jgi:hypothetical protein